MKIDLGDPRRLDLILAVAEAAVREHTGCGPETCGGTRYDECRLGGAITSLMEYDERRAVERGDLRCRCSRTERMYCASDACHGGADVEPDWLWTERPLVDVRTGDVVRRPGRPDSAATVETIGPVVPWGVNDLQPLTAYQQRDIQYNPGRYVGGYAVRRAQLRPLDTTEAQPARLLPAEWSVEIRMTADEIAAIVALGGWGDRVDPAHLADVESGNNKSAVRGEQ